MLHTSAAARLQGAAAGVEHGATLFLHPHLLHSVAVLWFTKTEAICFGWQQCLPSGVMPGPGHSSGQPGERDKQGAPGAFVRPAWVLGAFWPMLRAAVQGLMRQEWSTLPLPTGRSAELNSHCPHKLCCSQLCLVASGWLGP